MSRHLATDKPLARPSDQRHRQLVVDALATVRAQGMIEGLVAVAVDCTNTFASLDV